MTPVVDVIILSKASHPRLRRMTQSAIDSCRGGARLPVNVIVLEQEFGVRYRHATTVSAPAEFHYNRFANRGAAMGTAEWIMVANNDVVFGNNWLRPLLEADHPVVSPRCPSDGRMAGIRENTTGTRVGRHFAGWCFMIRRELWEKIGGFDECVSFWCSDDVVIEQVKAVGVQPMVVPASIVEHTRSVTLRKARTPDELTWEQLDIFIAKFGEHRLTNDPRYLRWKATHGR